MGPRGHVVSKNTKAGVLSMCVHPVRELYDSPLAYGARLSCCWEVLERNGKYKAVYYFLDFTDVAQRARQTLQLQATAYTTGVS